METTPLTSQEPVAHEAEPPSGAPEAAPVAPEGDEWAQKYQTLQEQYLRLAADFENFRKRSAQEQLAQRRYATESTLQSLFPVIDNLERASTSLNEQSDPKLLYQSFRLMYNQLLEAFSGLGVKRMQAVGQPFDPAFHEAVSQVETADYPENTVVQELQSGFMLEDKVLRPAMVTVSTAPADASAPPSNPFSQAGAESGNA